MKCIFETEHLILRAFFSGVTGDFFEDVVADGELYTDGKEQRVLETLSPREERRTTWRGTIWIGMARQGRGNGRHGRHQEDCDRGNAVDETLRACRARSRSSKPAMDVAMLLATVCSRRR